MGRPRLFEKPMTGAELVARHRLKQKEADIALQLEIVAQHERDEKKAALIAEATRLLRPSKNHDGVLEDMYRRGQTQSPRQSKPRTGREEFGAAFGDDEGRVKRKPGAE